MASHRRVPSGAGRRHLVAAALAAAAAAAAPPAATAARLAVPPRASRSRSTWAPPLPPAALHPPHAPSRYRRVMAGWAPHTPAAPGSDPVLSPVDYGADPTGVSDSAAAFAAVVAAAVARNTSGHRLADGIVDLGGVTVDLGGGDYLLSAPMVWPAYTGNYRIIHGTVRAAPSFPPDRWLIEVGSVAGCANGQGSCNEDVGVEGVFFDGAQVAAGGLRVSTTMGANVGPQVFVLNFTAAGIQIDGGHEVMIHETWIGEFIYSDKRKENGTASTAVGVLINGNDHVVADTIVFSSHVGVRVNGNADLLSAVHTWNLAEGNGGIGIEVLGSQNRFDGVYLDWNNLVFRSAQTQVVTDSFFLCGGHVVFAPTGAADALAGVTFLGNEFWCVNQGVNTTIELNTTAGTYTEVRDFTVVGTVAEAGFAIRGPAATRVVTSSTPTTTYTVDFSDALAFDAAVAPIQSVTYSVTLPTGTPVVAHAARPPVGAVVTVELASAAAATVTITVDQSVHSHGTGR